MFDVLMKLDKIKAMYENFRYFFSLLEFSIIKLYSIIF